MSISSRFCRSVFRRHSKPLIFSRFKTSAGSATTTTTTGPKDDKQPSSALSSISSASDGTSDLTTRINASVNLALNKSSELPSTLAESRADIISGIPEEVAIHRKVRIYRPCKTAMQSGTKQTHKWKLDFDVLSKWENPTMGWTSSADPLQALTLKFDSMAEAVRFAESQGWNYWIDEPEEPEVKPKAYADNFKYSSKKLRFIKTK